MRKWQHLLVAGVPLATVIGVFVFALGFGQEPVKTEEAGSTSDLSNETCLGCHGKDGQFDTNSKYRVDESAFHRSVHKDQECVSCHSWVTKTPHEGLKPEPVQCLSCHEESMYPIKRPRPDPPGGFVNSIHRPREGQLFPADMPTCLSCHGPTAHAIVSPRGWTKKQMADKCARCHEDPERMHRHRLTTKAASSYFTSFHGKAIKYGDQRTATCVDCHNAHNVQDWRNPTAPTNSTNVRETCRYCHKTANFNFAMSGVGHLDLAAEDHPALAYVSFFFYALTWFALGMLGLFLVFDVRRSWVGRNDRKPLERSPKTQKTVLRWTLAQRATHWLLLTSVVLLILTGFPLKYPDVPAFKAIYSMFGGIGSARIIHRIAALGLIAVAVLHPLMLLVRWAKYKTPPLKWPLIPNKKDFYDAWETLSYFFGVRKSPPPYPRYSFREKFDYWAVFWGLPVMAISGLVLWFPGFFTERLPGLIVSMAFVAHSEEALIAALAIIGWHMYNAHLSPGVFPMSKVWLTGKLTKDEVKHHHPLEFAELENQQPPKDDAERE